MLRALMQDVTAAARRLAAMAGQPAAAPERQPAEAAERKPAEASERQPQQQRKQQSQPQWQQRQQRRARKVLVSAWRANQVIANLTDEACGCCEDTAEECQELVKDLENAARVPIPEDEDDLDDKTGYPDDVHDHITDPDIDGLQDHVTDQLMNPISAGKGQMHSGVPVLSANSQISGHSPEMDTDQQNYKTPDVDACSVEAALMPGRRLKSDITIDSGAARSVMHPDDVPEYMLVSSEGQRSGQHFVGAGGERMPNLGQKTVPLLTVGGVAKAATFQAAAVRKPLLAVSASCDVGQLVIFDNDISCMLERDSPEGREIRRLAKQCMAKTPFERKGGVYTMPAWVVPPEKLNPADRKKMKPADASMEVDQQPGFPRQGM